MDTHGINGREEQAGKKNDCQGRISHPAFDTVSHRVIGVGYDAAG